MPQSLFELTPPAKPIPRIRLPPPQTLKTNSSKKLQRTLSIVRKKTSLKQKKSLPLQKGRCSRKTDNDRIKKKSYSIFFSRLLLSPPRPFSKKITSDKALKKAEKTSKHKVTLKNPSRTTKQ